MRIFTLVNINNLPNKKGISGNLTPATSPLIIAAVTVLIKIVVAYLIYIRINAYMLRR
jgi:hypothetical protein